MTGADFAPILSVGGQVCVHVESAKHELSRERFRRPGASLPAALYYDVNHGIDQSMTLSAGRRWMSDKPNFPWLTLRIYPELKYVRTRKELAEIGQAHTKSPHTRWMRRWAWVAPFPIAIVLGLCAVPLMQPGWPSMLVGAAYSLGCFVGFFLLMLISRNNYRRFLREYLQTQGVPICSRCAYDLRGQTEPRCPECGEGFDISLLAVEPADDHTSSGDPSL